MPPQAPQEAARFRLIANTSAASRPGPTSRDGSTVIVLQGRFDFNSHREFRDAVDRAVKEAPGEIKVDLATVMGSTMVADPRM